MAGTLHRRIRSAGNGQGSAAEEKDAKELWEYRKNFREDDLKRLHQLTSTWEMICQKQTKIAISTCDNSYTLNPEFFTANFIIADECSQTIEPASLLKGSTRDTTRCVYLDPRWRLASCRRRRSSSRCRPALTESTKPRRSRPDGGGDVVTSRGISLEEKTLTPSGTRGLPDLGGKDGGGRV
jgi:hypothetical protein